jgi:hypothetical protein
MSEEVGGLYIAGLSFGAIPGLVYLGRHTVVRHASKWAVLHLLDGPMN